MTNNPDVSVVMAVYNGQQYVEESINSILSQSYSNFEFIIVDDGSNDLTSQILLDAQSKDKRIFLITNETNKGISYSLNSAIAISRGEYIARMDSDDIAISNRLELQLEFLRKHSECVIVGGKIEVIGDSAHTVEINQFSDWYNQHSHSEDIKKQLFIGNCINHPSVVIRKKSFTEVGGYREEFNGAEDYDLFLRLANLGTIEKVPEIVLKYRIHTNQISMVHKEKQRDLDALIKSNLLANQFLKKTSLVLIWGASKGGERIAEKLIDKGFNVVGFIDRDFKKWGKNILERPVYGDHTSLPAIEYEYIVIATTPGRADAAAILDSLGKVFKKDYIYVW